MHTQNYWLPAITVSERLGVYKHVRNCCRLYGVSHIYAGSNLRHHDLRQQEVGEHLPAVWRRKMRKVEVSNGFSIDFRWTRMSSRLLPSISASEA